MNCNNPVCSVNDPWTYHLDSDCCDPDSGWEPVDETEPDSGEIDEGEAWEKDGVSCWDLIA